MIGKGSWEGVGAWDPKGGGRGLLQTEGKTTICNGVEGKEAGTDTHKSLATGNFLFPCVV